MPAPALATLYRTAFVTGASAGLGFAFAEHLLAEGVCVWGTARDPARLGALAARPGFTAVALDLRDGPAAGAALQQAMSAAGGFDLVINNAGFGVFGGTAATDADVWRDQIDAMLQTTLRLAHDALRDMTARGRGVLVNVTSLAVEFPLPGLSGYNVAKAGLAAWSESVAYELAPGGGVAVIDFRPGDYRTDFNRATAHAGAATPALDRVWRRLEANLAAAPAPARAVADLHRALLRPRSGVVRSGDFFQARLAPLLARLAPAGLRRAVQRRYFGLS